MNSQSTLQGRLSGKPGNYFLTEKDGRRHILMGDDSQLKPYLGKNVKLSGEKGMARDASASSDQGSARGSNYFRVDSVTPVTTGNSEAGTGK